MAVGTDPRVGTEFASYRIEALLGRGGMADVYLASDPRLGRKVALKLIGPHLAADEHFRERFLRESRLAASLDHANVVPVYEAGEADGLLYIAMRYVEGTDLRRILVSEGSLGAPRALTLLGRVADALDGAHARGLVHRDVKPANLLIAFDPDADPQEHVYLSDFGLTTGTAAEADSTRFSGTADYSAPEQITGDPVDGRADQYALACVLFECLTGEPPFRGDSMIAVLWAHVNDPPPAASLRAPELPDALDPVLARGLAKDPAERYGSCRELIAEARGALEVPPEAPAATRRGRWLVLGIAVLLAVLAAILSVVLTQGSEAARAAPGAGHLVRIDPATNDVDDTVTIGIEPTGVAIAKESVWATTSRDSSVWHVDAETLAVQRLGAQGDPPGLAVDGDSVYVAAWQGNLKSSVTRLQERTGTMVDVLDGLECVCAIGAGGAGVWFSELDLLHGKSYVMRRSTVGSPRVVASVTIPEPPADAAHARWSFVDLAVGEDAVWLVGDTLEQRLFRIDPAAERLAATIELPGPGRSVALGEGSVWVTDQLGDEVWRIDPKTNRIVATIPVGRGARGISVGAGSVWVALAIDQAVMRIDPATNGVVATIDVGESAVEVAAGDGSVWVATDGR